MGNFIYFMNFLELCCQCKMWNGIFLACWYKVGTWPSRVHPWRLRSMHPWWWYRYFRENNVWTWRVNVDLVLKTCIARPLIIFYYIGLDWGKRFDYMDALSEVQWRIFSLISVVEGLLFAENYLPPWKYIGESLNCDHLGVADVVKWRLGCWVIQGMG